MNSKDGVWILEYNIDYEGGAVVAVFPQETGILDMKHWLLKEKSVPVESWKARKDGSFSASVPPADYFLWFAQFDEIER